MKNIFAWTEPTPTGGYPAFVSINRDSDGRHSITVRSRGDGGRNVVTVEMPVEIFDSMVTDVIADLYREEPAKAAGKILGNETDEPMHLWFTPIQPRSNAALLKEKS